MTTVMERGSAFHLPPSMKRDRDISCVAEDLSMAKKRSKKATPSRISASENVEGTVIPEDSSFKTDVITEVMDIQEPLAELKKLLEKRFGLDLSSFQIWLQDKIKMQPQKSLSDQCIQSEGLAQIKVELKQLRGNNRVNIIDVLKYPEDSGSDVEGDEDDLAVEVEEDVVEDLSIKSPKQKPVVYVKRDKRVKNTQPAKWTICTDINSLFPIPLPNDPSLWSEVQIQHWLRWAMEEFHVSHVNESMWTITGQQLCQMTLEEFHEKVPVDSHNMLWTHIELLRKCRIFAIVDKPGRSVSGTSLTQTKPSQIQPSHVPKARTSSSSSSSSGGTTGRRLQMTGHNGQIQLWQFLLEILADRRKKNVIQWVGRNGEFKLIDPELVAQMWGERKNKPKMNYEKLSRALRYYYSEAMIAKVHGRRFVYKFVCNLKELVGHSAEELISMVEDDSTTLLSD
ncbi:unnamed protein product [Allacma fusca]|uniref:DNA-binding protein Ets97D n=1 Tax=Allacma fusca TaxID=39272 RepID=A0A8J2L7N9_9HEXA|nr:unnamed protein product [Allacma fusca]